MESLTCRFRIGQAVWEAVLGIALSFLVVTPFTLELDSRRMESRGVFVPGASASLALIGILLWRRWRSRFVVDEGGVEFRRSARKAGARLDWGEIEEVFLLSSSGFEIRGGGRRFRLTDIYENVFSAREKCARRMERVRDHLQARALQEGKVVFQMPGGRWKAHLAYLLSVLVLTGATGLCVAQLLKRSMVGFPVVIVLFGGSWLWGLRKRASGLGTQVTLDRGGVEVRRLDAAERFAWEELDRTEWNDKDGLDLVLRAGRVVSLPSALGNIALLEEYLRDGRAGAESEAQRRPEDRTMMQSS
jgi:hypothetical protein